MNERFLGRLLVLLSLMLGLVGGFVALADLTMAEEDNGTAKTLDRNLEPVIITGAKVGALSGFPVNELFVYSYANGIWWQIPAQVDEVTASGDYAVTEDNVLDADDEIVFMAMDLGDRAVAGDPITASLSISVPWYEIEVTDPINSAKKGWAYIVRSNTLTPTFTANYVDYDLEHHRIEGTTYGLGIAIPHPYFDYLTLNGGDDILDRTKTRLCLTKSYCPIHEDNLPGDPQIEDDLIEDGPVRVIVRGGKGLAYHSMVEWTRPISGLEWIQPHMRFSTDFNEQALGATYYNAVVPEGVTVDGEADFVAEEPVSSWFQLSTDEGTLIQIGDTTSMGGTQYNYYEDDSTYEDSDTGDGKRYGDTGVFIKKPNQSFTYTFALYSLPGAQPNLGTTYEAFFMQPLSARASLQGLPVKVYLPITMKDAATTSTSLPDDSSLEKQQKEAQ
jgi:hypothetical protein